MSNPMIESLEGRELMSADVASFDSGYVNEIGGSREANGIIAVLIALVQSPQPTGEEPSLRVVAQGTEGSLLLPYVEQENVYRVAGNGLMEEEGIWYFVRRS